MKIYSRYLIFSFYLLIFIPQNTQPEEHVFSGTVRKDCLNKPYKLDSNHIRNLYNGTNEQIKKLYPDKSIRISVNHIDGSYNSNVILEDLINDSNYTQRKITSIRFIYDQPMSNTDSTFSFINVSFNENGIEYFINSSNHQWSVHTENAICIIINDIILPRSYLFMDYIAMNFLLYFIALLIIPIISIPYAVYSRNLYNRNKRQINKNHKNITLHRYFLINDKPNFRRIDISYYFFSVVITGLILKLFVMNRINVFFPKSFFFLGIQTNTFEYLCLFKFAICSSFAVSLVASMIVALLFLNITPE